MDGMVQKRSGRAAATRLLIWGATVAVVVALAATFQAWWPGVQRMLTVAKPAAGEQHADEHEGHAHAHGSLNSLEVSPQARKSIGLAVGKVVLGPYEKTVSIPGLIVERAGRTTTHVTAPLTGVVSYVGATRGEAVRPGQRLFELRLTDEDVVAAQASLLRTVEELDVIAREIDRLDEVTREGGIARKELLDRQYEKQKQEATLRAQKQALLLHGLSQAQIDEIVASHMLLRTFTIDVPTPRDAQRPSGKAANVLQLQQLNVATGQSVQVGETLALLADPSELLIEADAFEKDVPLVTRAAEQGWRVTAVLDDGRGQRETLKDLPILFVDGKVDPAARTCRFYVTLANPIVRDVQTAGAAHYVDWKYKLGQRLQVLTPVEVWKERIVLPAEAVAEDGLENFVFQENGKKFDRRPVHVEHRDETHVVVANDGSIFVGDVIAMSAAQQLLIGIKNAAGGGIDPHAGHNHQ
jgi:multidrug efflux pump subunit AcrA (membrane-fusion protein)